ncbi:Serine/threonine-protein phosphatase 7 long form [Glycine soja]
MYYQWYLRRHVNQSGPIDEDVLWMQPKHVSKHVWNGEAYIKLHIRQVVLIYQGQEEILEEIIPLLRQSSFYWIMKMAYLKINSSLIAVLIERWRLETHTFHMRCGECTINLQDVSVLLGLRVDGAPLIVKPREGELQGSMVKLSWLTHHFSQINNHDGNVVQLQRFTRAWILRFIGGVLFVDKSSSKVSLSTYAWGPAVFAFLYREMCSATDYKIKSIGGMCILIQMWAWERCTTLAPKRTPPEPYTATVMSMLPPICLVGSVAWCAVVPLICFHVVERHQPDRVLRQFGMQQPIPECPLQPLNIHGLTLKGKQDENWFQLLAPMISQWNNRPEFRVDMFDDPKNANTATLAEVAETLQYMITILSKEQEKITKPVAHGPASERRFPPQEFYMLQSSVETRGFGRRREVVEAEEFSQQMEQRGHGMYYTPPTFSQYPFEGHDTDMSTSEHLFGGVAETHPHFSWPTMIPSQQHDVPMATPNAPLAPQWNVPGAIPNMGD